MTTDTGAFAALGLNGPRLQALEHMGWTTPTEIQIKLIPPALAGQDILGQAQTGTGKTAAFGLPILQNLQGGHGVRCLILAPTRELAAQVAGEMRLLGRFGEHKIATVYGGARMKTQVQDLKAGASIVVGTPGRVMDMMQRRLLSLEHVSFVVLDEVDRMLDIGFREDVRHILSHAATQRQTIFVSATIHEEINRLARQYMRHPVEVFCAPDKLTVDQIDQCYVSVAPEDKKRLLVHLLKVEKPSLALVFTRTKRDAAKVAHLLREEGVNAREIHGDLEQRDRDKVMKRFREGELHVLVATDLASRGIDVDDISHVINYELPDDPEVYVHRVGRTARMGAAGKAFTFVTPDKGRELTQIEILINRELPGRIIEGFTPSQPPAGAASGPAAMRAVALRRPNRRPVRRRR
ncbi:MAG: DEAD/DEAH box helicase [Planctomycetaceae bacterium]|nr:DEAD/DEAH box helicase [Planctomycetaceae bacterium]